MKTPIERGMRRLMLLALLAVGSLPLAAQAYTYSVLIDSDNDPATGCTVATPNGVMAGVDARLDAQVSFEPLQVQTQQLSLCEGGSFSAPQNLAAGHPVGIDNGPGPTDVVELGFEIALLGGAPGTDWNLGFLASSPLLGAADAAGPVLAVGLGVPVLPPPVQRPVIVPAASAWSLMLLCLALGVAAAWTLRRHPGLMLAALMVGAMSSAGIAWAAGFILDGEIGDWNVAPLLVDPAGDTTQPEPQVDLRGVYAARDGGHVFFRFDVTEMRLPVLVPPFLQTSFSVDENTPNTTLVGSINTAPGGLSTLLRFALSSQSPSAGFSVDAATGEIRVADSSQLDFETRPSFTLDVAVTLQGAAGFSLNRQVTVTLNDLNEAPQIAAQAFSVFENAVNGELVGTVIASDPDAGANGQLSYSVVGGTGQAVFAINTASGQITVADANALSLAASPYSLQVQVSDGGTPALSATAVMTISVDDVNDAPSFTPGPSPVTVLEDSAPYSAAWATAISDGDDGTQVLTFEFTGNTNPALFAVAPAISASGVLSFTLAADANGSADLGVRLRDNGGTANGGVDVSPIANFTITVTPVNDAPSFMIPASAPAVLEGAGPQTVPAFATAISAGPPDEAGQVLSFTATVTATTGNLAFSSLPALAPNGSLSYAPQAGTSGTATVSVVLSDDGGTANGGVDTSAPQTFTLQVTNVNDAPSFTPGPSPITVLEDSGAYAAAWATDLNDNDGGIQALSFVVLSNSNPALFVSGPALSPTGELSFTPAPDANGSATLSVALRDDGGTDNGGVDQSAPVELVLNVTAVNDAPSFVIPAAASPVLQDAGPVVQAAFATAISAGPANEAAQTLEFIVSVTGASGSLTFAQPPAINPANGNLSFVATNGTSGTATVSVVLRDDGGTANGGVDTSAPQVFTLQVVNVNDAPSFTPGPSPVVVLEDSAPYSAAWATNINDNDGGTQALSFELTATGTTGTLAFTTPPSISPTGVLSFALAPDTNGSASFSVVLRDDGGTDFGGVDVSPPVQLAIEVTTVNDAPSFSIPATAPSVLANSPPQTVPGFATGISPGPVDEAGQNLSFTVTVIGTTGNLGFSTPPAIDAGTGTLSYAASANSFGVATISVVLNDDGGTDNGGVNASAPQQFTLEVQFVNSAPSFMNAGNVAVDEDSGPYSAVWATAIDDGEPGITQGLGFIVLANDNPALFTALPAINATTGALSFESAPNANGVANLSVVLQDDGGTANGGADTSAAVEFSITVNPINDPPVVVPPTNVAVARHIGRSLGSASPESLLANVSDPADGPGAAPFSATVQTNAPTAQGGRVSVAADGSWSYQPPAGAALASDSFDFQVCDSGVPLPPACTVATATIALSGNAVWFVDAAAAAGGDGTLARPFNTLAAATAAAGANGRVFVASGSYSAGATLLPGQWLIGQGVSVASATSFDSLFGLSPPAGSAVRPTIGGTRPLLTTAAGNAITLAAGNSLRGIEIGNTAGIGLVGNDFGTLTLGDNRISGSGQALSLGNGTLAEAPASTAFDQVISSSGASNIVLSAVAGSANFGSGALSGATGTAFQFSTGTASLSYAGTIAKASAGRLIDIEGAGAANLSLSGDLTCSALCGSGAGNQGLRVSGRTGGTITFSGSSKVFTGNGTNPAVQLLNNTGATIAITTNAELGTNASRLAGTALAASGGGTLVLDGNVSIFTAAARSMQISGMTLSGSMTGTIASDGALGTGTPAIDIQNSASPAGLTFGQQLIIDHDDAGESGGGINLANNTGSYTFSNIVRVTSSNTVALRASNAGTLTVGNVAAGELTNSGGIAIDVQNTTIGANGLNATRVQSLGGVHGILLSNTGTLGALTITGSGGTCTSSATCTGGFIANTSSHGVQLVNTVAPSITRMRIQNTGGNGVNGTEVNGFTFASGSIDGTGAAIANNSANIAFNATAAGTERNVFGAVSITDSSLSNSRHHGIELFNFNGTLSSVTISGNTLTSSTSAATSQGWGIGLIARGSASAVASVSRADITNNVISNFPGGGGIQVQGGNATSPAAPVGSMGTPGSATNIINITGNRIAGESAANRIGAEGIVANVAGRGQGNFNISNNGTVANPISNVTGIGISHSAFGLANVTSLIENNVIAPNNSFASQGIGGGVSNTFGVSDAPQMTITVRGNTISQTDGNGILLVARDSNGTLRARVQNNSVAAPLSGARQGIRIDSGNGGDGENDTVCLDISGNTSAPSVGFPTALGIGLRKQGTAPGQFAFGVVGMAATGSPGVENFVNGLNPAGGGTLLISASLGFSNCSFP